VKAAEARVRKRIIETSIITLHTRSMSGKNIDEGWGFGGEHRGMGENLDGSVSGF